MDSSIPGSTNSPLLTPAVFGDNAQDFLGNGVFDVHRGVTIVVNSIDDTISSSPGVTTLRDAINKANADCGNDLIVFDRSLFSTAQTITLNLGELDIIHDLDIVAPRDTLTGGDLVTVSGNKSSRVFEIETGATVSIDGLIVADGSVTGDDGGGIKNFGTLSLDSSIVRNNSARAISSGSVFTPPRAIMGGNGGGIYNQGTLTVGNSTISGNLVSAEGFIFTSAGGGISNGGTLTVENSTISGNRGGGISNGGTLTVENSTVSGNSAGGDGINNLARGIVTVENSTISDNLSNGIYNFARTVTVENSTISGNGHGIYNNRGTVTVENSTISGNQAKQGGGIYNDYRGTLKLLFSTVTQNIAANGGGVYQNDVPPPFTPNPRRGSFNVRNTIITANLNSDGGINPDVSGTFTSSGYNLIGDGTGSTGFGATGDIVGTSLSPIDPRLAPLDFNGGPTQTIALLPDSPAIDAGDPTVLDTDPTTDQRGFPRRALDGSTDIGAYQFSS